jgi:hypothetical protein
MEVGTVKRAFQLARSGQFEDVSKLEKALHREGFEAARMHLGSPGLSCSARGLAQESSRGMTPQRLIRVKRALELSRQKMTHVQIAEEMSMSISGVTQLLHDGRAEEAVAKVLGRSF